MKKLFTLLLAVAASVGTMFAWDYERVQIGDLYYNLDATNQTAAVTSPSNKYSGAIVIPSSVTYNSVTYSVTSIGNSAFELCYGLTSVTIPNSVTSIGRSAFSGCRGLTSVTIPNSVTSIGERAFEDCRGLTSVTIGNSVTSIGNYAFMGCSGLTSVTIPNSVTSIGKSAFNACTGLTSVVYNAHVFAFMPTSYSGAYTIPDGIESIAGGAFYGCTGLTSIDIPNSVTSIGEQAFESCSGLTSVTIPNSVTSIGGVAFYKCTGLTSVTIPNSVTSIGNGAFSCCSGLTSVTIPNSVTIIVYQAFEGCSGLTSVTIPNSVTSIGYWAFYNCTSLTSVTIPNSVTSIGGEAFYNCTGLTSITCEAITPPTLDNDVFYGVNKSIPLYVPAQSIDLYKFADQWKYFTNILPIEETPGTCLLASGTCGAQGDNLTWTLTCDSTLTISGTGTMADYDSENSVPWYSSRTSITSVVINNSVASIGSWAFYGCSGLTSITIPNGVKSIGNSAFFNCYGLTSITIPNSVTSIGDYAFAFCRRLTSITCEATTPPTLKYEVFSYVDKSIPVYVSYESIDLYKTSNGWKDFTNILPKDAYWVEFIDWDGTKIQSGWVKENTAAIPPLDPVREGYTFVGWDKPLNNITEDLIVTAQYSINHYPVVLLDHDGKLLSKQSVAYNRAAEVPEIPVREGYTFAGWTTDIEHIIDTTYAIAVYDKIGGTVIYKAEDGEIIGSENVDLHLPAAPMISGKTFAGWLTESVDSESGIVLRATYTTDNPTTHDDVSVVPSSTTAAVNFPYITGALTYELVIRDLFGHVVCKILFNSTGHLLGIALAPGRDRSAAPAQTDGFNFTVEGLDPNTTYNYEFVAHDDTDEVIETLSGSFTTTDDTPTGVENVQSNNVQCTKIVHNGQIFILRGEKVYTLAGQEVR